MIVQSVRLDQIDLEGHGRKTLSSAPLRQSLAEDGLVLPLVVEGPLSNGRYVLVEGYRRFHNLVANGEVAADCIIQVPTSQTQRQKKRVKHDYLGQKKTGFERERLLAGLLVNGLSRREIARETNIPRQFINKYLKSEAIPTDVKARAEESGAGQDGLAKLYFNERIRPGLRLRLIDRYTDAEGRRNRTGLLSYHVDAIYKVTKCRSFPALSSASQERCINEAVESSKFTLEMAQRAVSRELLNYPDLYDDTSHRSVFDDLEVRLQNALATFTPVFLDSLSKDQRVILNELADRLRLATPLVWEFK